MVTKDKQTGQLDQNGHSKSPGQRGGEDPNHGVGEDRPRRGQFWPKDGAGQGCRWRRYAPKLANDKGKWTIASTWGLG